MASSIPSTMKAIQIEEQGGPDVMKLKEIPVPRPGKGEVLIKVEYSGVNFIDTYKRGGVYKVPLPYVMGHEPAGKVAQVGEGVTDYQVGDKVAAYISGGAFADYVVANEKNLAKLPEAVSTRDGAASLLQGLTVLSLIKEACEAKKGQYILVHAAAGGIGLLACQMLSHFGIHVIGTTSTEEKAKLAKENGAEHVIIYSKDTLDDVVKQVKALTPDGEGVHAVLDGVGKDTWESDFEVIRRKGMLVTFGNASGPVEPFAPLKLAAKNLKVCRPTLNNYVATKQEMQAYSKELYELYANGAFKVQIWKEGYPFSEEGLKQAQDDLVNRRTTGKLIINMS